MHLALRCAFLLPIAFCFGQTGSVLLCGVELKSAMPKSKVLDDLGKQCKVEKMSVGFDASCVQGLGQFRCSNWVRFDDDKLTQVMKDLGTAESDDAAAVLAEVIQAVEQIASRSDGPTPQISVETSVSKHDDGDWQDVVLDIKFGPKSLAVQVSRPIGARTGHRAVSRITATEWDSYRSSLQAPKELK
jgi:hypothetical protein